MPVTASYPSVYLSETVSLNFSIANAATAVPAFAYRSYSGQSSPDPVISRYDSFAEFNAAIDSKHPESDFFNSVKYWFMQGGGYCYLVQKESVLEQLPKYDDISLLVAAGTEDDIFGQFNTLVNSGYSIFGLFDGPQTEISKADNVDNVMKEFPATPHAAAFYPWCHTDWTISNPVPPSVVAAACIAKTDRTHGVWKAPANLPIDGITPKYPISDKLQGRFNQGKALNMIRTFPDVGTVIWGARTLEDSDNWRYIPVRRLFSMVERDIQKALSKLLFAPNTQPTWQRVKAATDNYLYSLWQQGALAGNRQEEAWFVHIGKDTTMTEDDIKQGKQGKMVVNIGLAASRPAEFILLQFTQNIAG